MSIASNKKILNWFWILLLLVFAYLQFNDPDPFKWVLLYSLLALLIFLHSVGMRIRIGFVIYSVVIIILILTNIPSCLEWIQAGMPSLTQEMKATDPTIESMRELGGLMICLLISLIYYKPSKF
jgi:hypothetical protein